VPFGFRKSLRIAPGVRLNVSKSGLGISAGIKGLRVSAGPRGTYWRASAHGFSYSQRIGAPTPRSAPSASGTNGIGPSVTNTVLGRAAGVGDDIASNYSIARRRMPFVPWFICFGTLALLFATANWPMILTLMLLAGVVAGTIYLAREDRARRSIFAEYDLTPSQVTAYDALDDVMTEVERCGAIWCVTTTSSAAWKQHAGASALVSRAQVGAFRSAPAGFVTNVAPWTVKLPSGTLTFLPDRVLIVRERTVSDARYHDIRITARHVDFREDAVPPRDAMQVGTTWQHPNKNGGPDLRYAHNPVIPIFRYAEVELVSGATTVLLQFSRSDIGTQLVRAVQALV
jgi:hypothetical protein